MVKLRLSLCQALNEVKQASQHPAHQRMHILSSTTDHMWNHFEGTVVLREISASLLGLQQLTCLLFAMFCLDCLCASVAEDLEMH